MSAEPTEREYKPPREKSRGLDIGPAERMRARPDALKVVGEFYRSTGGASKAGNELLARSGDRMELVRRNVPLVVYVVTTLLRMPGRTRNGKRSGFMHGDGAKLGFGREHRQRIDDLIQDGIIGLISASTTFNPEKGSFSTHAIPLIIAAIQQSNTRQGPVHVPPDVLRQVRVNPDAMPAYMHLAASRAIASFGDLSAPYGQEEEGETLADFVPEPEEPVMDNIIAQEALDALTPLERRVIEHRYGLVGPPLDLQATGTRLGLTRRQVREIERTAMRKMQAAT